MDDALSTKEVLDAILESDGSVTGGLSTYAGVNGQVSSPDSISGDMVSNQQVAGDISKKVEVGLDLVPSATIKANLTLPESRGGGTNDYEELINKPKINDVTLIKNKSFEELGLTGLTNLELEALLT